MSDANETVTIHPTGERPIRFSATLLKRSSSRANEGHGKSRYWDCRLYLTQARTYLLVIDYQTEWRGEVPFTWWTFASTPEELEKALLRWDALQYATGLRALQARSADKVDVRERSLELLWMRARGEILSVLEAKEIP